ncbi:Low-density lipoprotein (LDL) receptor class A repeat, partial [Trinorchestia longiramus]
KLFNFLSYRLEDFGLSRLKSGALVMQQFLLCVWFWLRFFTKSASPLSYAISNKESNTILLGVEGAGLFFVFHGREVRVKRSMEPARWYHICLHQQDRFFSVVLDGELVHTISVPIPSFILLNGTLIIGQDQDNLGGDFNPLQAFVGKIYGLNIWTSKDIIPQNTMAKCFNDTVLDKAVVKYKDINFRRHGDIALDEDIPCLMKNEPVYIIWPVRMSYKDSESLCNFLNMTVPMVTNDDDFRMLTEMIDKASAMCFGFLSTVKYAWISNVISDNEKNVEEEQISDTKKKIFELQILNDEENSSVSHVMLISSGKHTSANEGDEACAVCGGAAFSTSYFLRGICPRLQTVKFYPRKKNIHVYFHGNLNLVIEQEEQLWKIKTTSDQLIAVLEKDYTPFGKHTWSVSRSLSNCLYQSHTSQWNTFTTPKSMTLMFSACDYSEFACNDGTCLPSSARCSQIKQCSDGSDEDDCDFIRTPTGYSQNSAPPLTSLALNVSFSLSQVTSINIVKQLARMVMKVVISWQDTRLEFLNVNHDPIGNLVTNATNRIWLPIVQVNNEDRLEGTVPPRETLHLIAEGQPTFDGEENVFQGSDVVISYTLDLSSNINCFFRFHFYPFDTQRCNVEFSIVNAPNVHLNPTLEEGLGNEVEEQLPSEYVMAGSSILFENHTLVYSFWMSRNIHYPVFSIYFPTALMHLISYGTLWIPAMDFPDRGTMSLTTLLVLIALYSDILSQLPVTSYLKFLDLWFIFSITFISVIIFAHLITSNTGRVEKIGRRHHGICKNFYLSNSTILKRCRIWMGVGYLLFHTVYWSYLM